MNMNKKQKIDQAIILAAGFGLRMRPLTLTTPKPLVKLNKKPIIYYILEELKNNEIKKCFINVHYLPWKIEKYIEGYRALNKSMDIIIIKEKVILETGGAIKNILEKNGFEIVQHIKTTTYIETIFQTLTAYLYHSVVPKGLRTILTLILIAPLNLLGIFLGKILPNDKTYYLNNIILCVKKS